MNFRILMMSVAMAATAGAVWAKLPAAPADPAKAAEAKAKADDAAQKDADLLGKYQEKAVANYRKNKGIRGPASMAGKKKRRRMDLAHPRSQGKERRFRLARR